MNVLVAGCGYVGSALAGELARAGHRVLGLRRSAGALPTGVISVRADLTDVASLEAALDDSIDHVVYAASPSGRTEQAYEDAYVRGLENVLSVLERRGAPLRRALLTSSTAVYGQDDGSWVDEESTTEPDKFTGRVLLRAEAAVRGRSYAGAALRLAGIYGPGRTWLIRRVQSGEARIDPVTRYGNRIHLEDCAGALAHLLTVDELAPVYVGVDDAPAPLGEVYAFVASLLGVPVPPEGPSDEGRGGNKRCRNAKLRASGYALRVPTYREGYPGIVAEYLRERG
jgi:nucleoside-diphosphate-sugar epimerase